MRPNHFACPMKLVTLLTRWSVIPTERGDAGGISHDGRHSGLSTRSGQVVTLNDDPFGGEGRPSLRELLEPRTVPHSSTPSVHAGKGVTRGKHGNFDQGTAGLIVRKVGGQGRYMLTCAHVLGLAPLGQEVPDSKLVYSPELSECCDIECNNPIGNVVPETLQQLQDNAIQAKVKIGQVDFAVDASLVELAARANASNEVPKIGMVAGIRDLIAEWAISASEPSSSPDGVLSLPVERQIAVQKYGAKTQHSRGKIVALRRVPTKQLSGSQIVPGQAWVFEIEVVPPPGQEPVVEYRLDMQRYLTADPAMTPQAIKAQFDNSGLIVSVGGTPSEPTLIVRGRHFSLPGDSGAPILDNDRKTVGILTQGVKQLVLVTGKTAPVEILTGRSQGIFVEAAFKHLNVELLPPGVTTAGDVVAVPGTAIRRGGPPVDWSAIRAAWTSLESSELGGRLGAVIRRHMAEVRDLVHHNRRVMVTWHRRKGPAFVNAILRGAEQPAWPLPAEIDGVSPVDTLRAMRDVLMMEGSAGLRADLDAHQEYILDLARRATSLPSVLNLPDLMGPPAVRIVNSRGVPGVASVLVRDIDGAHHLLANHHVVHGAGAQDGEAVWALPPSRGDGAPAEPVRLGHAGRGRLGTVKHDGEEYFVDAALVGLGGVQNLPGWLWHTFAGPWPTIVAPPEPGAVVSKHGPATGLTEGILLDVAYPDRPFIDGREFLAPGQLLVGPRDPERVFSASGDSGAALLDEQRRLIGLLWGATAGGDGVACPIAPVLDCLGVTPVGSAEPAGAAREERS
ncbi:hypothetical protein AB0C27_28215 [Nonomuraea sp. NPDC048882]|uniref:hypothetical protein n=1 Tax=Nonomuraea sp. NPDC048882 TaxID=3154347 RepID=UPI0033C8C7F8